MSLIVEWDEMWDQLNKRNSEFLKLGELLTAEGLTSEMLHVGLESPDVRALFIEACKDKLGNVKKTIGQCSDSGVGGPGW